MYARVAPALKLPRALPDLFDYRIPEELADRIAPGSLVRIPWRGRPIVGVVFALSEVAEIDPKKVKPLVELAAQERVPHDALDAMRESAQECVIPLANIVDAFLPTIPKRFKAERMPLALPDRDANLPAPHLSIASYSSCEEKYQRATDAASAARDTGRSTIIIVPHADEVADAARACRDALGDEPVVWDGTVTMTKLWTAFRACASGNPVVVVGTRLAACAPVARLGAVVLLEADSVDHRQYDQNPRYDARRILRKRAESAKADLLFLSVAPRAEEYATAAADSWLTEIDPLTEDRAPVVAVIGKTATSEEAVLSKSALDAISKALRSGKKAILLHNRKGMANAVICRDCARALRCERCKGAEAGYGAQVRCLRCNTSRPTPLTCVACGSPSLKTIGLGTAALPALLAAHFIDDLPDGREPRIAVYDADNRADDATLAEADVIIGTQLLLHRLLERPHGMKIAVAVATLADDLFVSAGFRATENAWRTARALAAVITEPDGKAILQTLDADDARIRTLTEPPDRFYEEELLSRKIAAFPPHGAVVAVIAAEANQAAAQRKIADMLAELRRIVPKVRASGPITPRAPFRHNRWRAVAVIHGADAALVRNFLRTLPESLLIDVDPEYLG